jgi:glycosyltransferase involved in cell wall biosynthesis
VAKKIMNLPIEKMHTVHLGVDPDEYSFINSVRKKERTIGFISRMNSENGLDILVDAFIILKRDKKFDDVHLHVTGGSTGEDTVFVKEQKKKLEELGLRPYSHFWEKFENPHRQRFLDRMQLVSVPVRNGEAFGIYLTEAMASGIPVVQPALGAFPEIVNTAGGGVIYEPNTPEVLAKALADLLDNQNKLEQLSAEARESVVNHFDINKLAVKLTEIYKSL